MKTAVVALALVFLSTVVGCLFSQAQVPAHATPAPVNPRADELGRVVIRVNGSPFTESDVQAVMQKLFPFYAVHGGKIPVAREPEIRQKAVRQLIVEELVYQQAQRRKIAVSPLEVRKALHKVRTEFSTKGEYESWVQQRYGSERRLERQLRCAKMITRLWDVEVTKKAAVTEAELRAYYRKNKARFVRPESVALQSISVAVPQSATEEQRRQTKVRAEEVLAKARAAKNYEEFGVLAEKYSDDDWRVMMGDHKFVHRGSLAPELEQAAFQMQKGTTSGLLLSDNKYIILRVNDKTPPTQLSFAEVRARVRDEMQRQRLAARAQAFEAELREGAKIEQLNYTTALPTGHN